MPDAAADLELARTAAREAGLLLMRHFGRDMDVRWKGRDQPVTDADIAADRLLRDRLAGPRPGYGWLSEETVDNPERLAREQVWIVDPIDGTRSFVAGIPEFSISIGLAVAGSAVAGVVYNPATDELFAAVRGGGAWLERGGTTVRLDAGNGGGSGLLMASRSEIARGEFEAFRPAWQVLPVGSTAYKLARVAAGSGEAFLSRGPKNEWDICAGVLLVNEAGALATDMLGRSPTFNHARPVVSGILAAPPRSHGELLARITALPPLAQPRPDR